MRRRKMLTYGMGILPMRSASHGLASTLRLSLSSDPIGKPVPQSVLSYLC
jgi:hypothetical protein